MVVGYALSLRDVYVMALIIDALAPNFGGTSDRVQALKTIAYAYTACLGRRLAAILPFLGVLIVIAGAHLQHLPAVSRPAAHDEVPAGEGGGYTAVVDHRRDRAEPRHRR